MLHGLYGNEDVTWVFARYAGPEWLIISPRAPFYGKDGENEGYTWSDQVDHGPTADDNFNKGSAALKQFVNGLPEAYKADRSRVVLLGFSQGVAIAYAFAVSEPVLGVVALSGFIPPPLARNLPPLNGLPVLIVHGTKDETIPIEIARQNRDQLNAAGANVTYIESEVGHKASSAGLAELKRWLAERLHQGK
jgi:phospholipase/carboxylesterase